MRDIEMYAAACMWMTKPRFAERRSIEPDRRSGHIEITGQDVSQ